MDEFQVAKDKFILHWGEMGTRWGINKTMAQVHALLFITETPLSAEDIMEELQISRGNASMSLRELMNWGVVTKMHLKGERKEYYSTEKDVWEFIKIIARERKKREVDPTVATLREILAILPENNVLAGHYARQQITSLAELIETGEELYQQAEQLNTAKLINLARQVLSLLKKFKPLQSS